VALLVEVGREVKLGREVQLEGEVKQGGEVKLGKEVKQGGEVVKLGKEVKQGKVKQGGEVKLGREVKLAGHARSGRAMECKKSLGLSFLLDCSRTGNGFKLKDFGSLSACIVRILVWSLGKPKKTPLFRRLSLIQARQGWGFFFTGHHSSCRRQHGDEHGETFLIACWALEASSFHWNFG
jgi:hypothetical protein